MEGKDDMKEKDYNTWLQEAKDASPADSIQMLLAGKRKRLKDDGDDPK
jgi:hypothetical protein